MTDWKPPAEIRVKVLGLAWAGERLQVFPVIERSGRIKGMRPLGGAIEYGETRERAIVREFQEELGCGVELTGPWLCFENIYRHDGVLGHEIVFTANVRLEDAALYGREEIPFLEADGAKCTALWVAPTRLPDGVELYPTGLLPLIVAGSVGPDNRS